VPIAPVENIWRGNKVLKEWYSPGSQGAEIGKFVEAMKQAGGRARMDRFYATEYTKKMKDAFRSGNIPGGILRLPLAAIEQAAKPMMEWLVPRQKVGVFMDLARYEMERLDAKGAPPQEVRATMQKIWNSVDNRMGQLIYDNLFWNRTIKDLGMASVRSLGWNLGTFRELGGGAIDFAHQAVKVAKGQRPEMTYRMAYTVSLPIVSGTIGAIMQYLYTGQGPQELRDYFFPKTGKTDRDGNPARVSLPSYMKDIYHYYEEPGRTVTNKLHPALSIMADMLQNKDYFGTEIRNADDPIMKQLMDELKFGAKSTMPFSIQGAKKNLERGERAGAGVALPFIGITPAPRHLQQTDVQNEIFKTYERRKGHPERSQAQFERAQAKSEIVQAYKDGDITTMWNKIDEHRKKGTIPKKDDELSKMLNLEHAKLPGDIKAFGQLPDDDQRRLLSKMSVEEAAKYIWFAHEKVKADMYSISENVGKAGDLYHEGKINKPDFEMGYAQVPPQALETAYGTRIPATAR